MDAPERIWAGANLRGRDWAETSAFGGTQYVRADLYARLAAENERLRAAISWIEPPFVDNTTSGCELRARVKNCIDDAKRAALTGGSDGE